MLDPFSALAGPLLADGASGAQFSLVGFHTAFNVLGVALILPFARPFARLIAMLVRERGPHLTRRLDDQLLDDSGLAIEAAAATARDIARHMAETLRDLLEPGRRRGAAARLMAAREALDETRRFVDQLRTDPSADKPYRLHMATMHMLDHLLRLAHRCAQHERIEALQSEHRLRRLSAILRETCGALLVEKIGPDEEARLDRIRRLFRRRRRDYRERMVSAASRHAIDTDTTLRRLDAMRWLHRVVYHLWRVAHHASLMGAEVAPGVEPDAAVVEIADD
jgi:phosphate:Na+ symporter